MIPARTDIYFAYLNYLVETGRIDAAEEVWFRLPDSRLAFEPRLAFPDLDGLIRAARITQLQAALWEFASLRARHFTSLPAFGLSPLDLI